MQESGKVIECFEITDHGVVVIIDASTNLPKGVPLYAVLVENESHEIQFVAYKESMKRSGSKPLNNEGFLLKDAYKEQIALGSILTLSVDPAMAPKNG